MNTIDEKEGREAVSACMAGEDDKPAKELKNCNGLVGLRTCCADRKNTWNDRQSPIAAGDFQWIFARNGESAEQLRKIKEKVIPLNRRT